MGSLFRSEEMTLCQLLLQVEDGFHCVLELGELGVVQFRDSNPGVNAFQRKFVNQVRRCDELERKLWFLESEIKQDAISMLDDGNKSEMPKPGELIDLEAIVEKLEFELKEANACVLSLKINYLQLTDMKNILQKMLVFFKEHEDFPFHEQRTNYVLSKDSLHVQLRSEELGYVAGVILRERIPAFERMLWRACHGNVFLRQAEIDTPLENPVTGDQVHKSVFIIFFQGDQLKSRVKKICEGFRATLYSCPETPTDRREMAIGVMTRIEDLNTVLAQTQDHRRRVLVAAAKNVCGWLVKVRKIKAVYHTLNLFNLDVIRECLIAECWCPLADLKTIHSALHAVADQSGSSVPPLLNRMDTTESPPTYNRTNKFTAAFQNIIDAYGVASYREINPAPFTIITFPFLFSVMFGDAGHGIIMSLFAIWMVLSESKLLAAKTDNEIWNAIFGGRYIILLMGLFSVYTGIIYNDVFSKSFNIFGSSWRANYSLSTLENNKALQLDPSSGTNNFHDYPYPFGLDPVWQVAVNKLNFHNSYKKKVSVILGVIQMLFGVILSLGNHRFFQKSLTIYCEFIPQVIFMLAIFGYLVILVFWKWTYHTADQAGCAPSLLITLINMFLMKYADPKDAAITPCYNLPFYNSQRALQTVFVVVAFLCIPVMLLVKPFMLRREHMMKSRMAEVHMNNADSHENLQEDWETPLPCSVRVEENARGQRDDQFEFGEVFVHQAIHTIEYCLGCISNTASYLRLWALSLAHAQLSEVLWSMVLRPGFTMFSSPAGGIFLCAVFAAWGVLTIAVLLIMEGLSAFLHALRLHWVEFNNKFYVGDGHLFEPFSFKAILENQEGLEKLI